MISTIICSANPPRFQACAAQWQRVMEHAREPWEVVGISDARSLCEGYQRGLQASKGDIIIFSHDDIELWSDDFVSRLKRHLATFDIVGVAGTSKLVGASWLDAGPPHVAGQVAHQIENDPFTLMFYGGIRRVIGGMQALDGLMLAFRRGVIEQVGWDDQTFSGFHFYDLDTTYRAYRAGFKLAVAMDLPLCHYSGGQYEAAWKQYAEAFLRKHGGTMERLTRRRVIPMAVRMDAREEIRKVMEAISASLPE